MYKTYKPNWYRLLLAVGIPLAVGIITSRSGLDYSGVLNEITRPPLMPPAAVFPVVWTILYVLMGVSAYLVMQAEGSPLRKPALIVWALQLALNAAWVYVFFGANAYFASFVLLIVLWLMIAAMIALFYKINPYAGLLQLPYIAWVTFAGYLTYMIYRLNG